MTDPAMPADIDRLLGVASVPPMPAGLIDRIVTEAVRPDRTMLPAPPARRPRARRWTRRGVWSAVVAVNLLLATAVAAAFGGGAPIFARIADVAQHVVQHLRHPFHHQVPRAPTLQPASIRAVPHGGVPMIGDGRMAMQPRVTAPVPVRPFIARPFVDRSARETHHVDRHVERVRHPERLARGHAGDRRSAMRTQRAEREPRDTPRSFAASRPPRIDSAPAFAGSLRGGDLRADGGRRFDGDRWHARTDAMDRAPGWRRRIRGQDVGLDQRPGANGPDWRRRGPMAGAMRTPRPRPFRGGGGGRRPRRF